jgi:nucleoside-diphosphate-sugar epimerase
MAKILIVGCGDLGAAMALRLQQAQHEVIGLRVSSKPLPAGVALIQADVTAPDSLHALVTICPDIIIYCIAAGAQTDAAYQAQYVSGLRNVLVTQAENPRLQHVFFVSSTRVYGQVSTEILDDSVTAVAADFGGERLLEAEALLKHLPCKATVCRLSGIYGPGRLRMINLAKSNKDWPLQNSWSNRIHRDDAAAFIVFLVEKVVATEMILPCYIVTDSNPVSQYEVLNWVAEKLHGPDYVPQLKAAAGGKRLSNQAMLASGFKLQYPDYQAGYQALLDEIAVSSLPKKASVSETSR